MGRTAALFGWLVFSRRVVLGRDVVGEVPPQLLHARAASPQPVLY